jgi:hypothetical protein
MRACVCVQSPTKRRSSQCEILPRQIGKIRVVKSYARADAGNLAAKRANECYLGPARRQDSTLHRIAEVVRDVRSLASEFRQRLTKKGTGFPDDRHYPAHHPMSCLRVTWLDAPPRYPRSAGLFLPDVPARVANRPRRGTTASGPHGGRASANALGAQPAASQTVTCPGVGHGIAYRDA